MKLLFVILFCRLLGLGSAWTRPTTCYMKPTTSDTRVEEELRQMREMIEANQATLQAIDAKLVSNHASMTATLSQLFYEQCQDPTAATTDPPTTAASTESTMQSTSTQQIESATTSQSTTESEMTLQPTESETTFQPTEPSTDVVPTTQPTATTSDSVTVTPSPDSTLSDTCGGPGWRQVAFINMSDPNQDCPQPLKRTSYPIRSCGRAHSNAYACSSNVILPTNGIQYSQVCGRISAYRRGLTLGFAGYHNHNRDINGHYVSGISLTHGSPRTHIWTFASGAHDGPGGDPRLRCPCEEDYPVSLSSPEFVGNDYFCESVTALENGWNNPGLFYADNALWDGVGCDGVESPCCQLSNPPWFKKNLIASTTDNIELRMCFWNPIQNADIAINLLELYVNDDSLL